jgi:hypothetical protein
MKPPPRPTVGSNAPPAKEDGVPYQGVKRPKRVIDHLTPISADVKERL